MRTRTVVLICLCLGITSGFLISHIAGQHFDPHNSFRAVSVIVAAGTIALGAAFGIIWYMQIWRVASDPAGRNMAIRTLIQAVGVIGILAGGYLAINRLEVNREGQITECFSRAITQLGDERLALRLGGIYALERIARDSHRDHWSVMQVLTAYVRELARWTPQGEDTEYVPLRELLPDSTGEVDRKIFLAVRGRRHQVPADIQAVLDVLRKRQPAFGRGEHRGLNLEYADLRGAQLEGANLRWAYMPCTNLDQAYLWSANMDIARMWGSSLRDAQMYEASLRETELPYAQLQWADLMCADLEGADLKYADLDHAWLWEACLRNVDFTNASLIGASLSGADLQGATLDGADLRAAYGLTQEQIESASGDERTQLPLYLDRPSQWANTKESQE